MFEIVQNNLNQQFPNPNYLMFTYMSPMPAFSQEECKTILEIAKTQKFEYQKVNTNKVNLSEFNAKMTAFEQGKYPQMDYVYDKIREIVVSINQSMWNFSLYDFGELIKVMEYSAEYNGFSISHSDMTHIGSTKYRKLTIVVQLSDEADYTGGELVIQHYDKQYIMPKKIGTIIIFPSFLLHRVEPVKSGVRYSLVGFGYGPPLR